MTLTRLSHQECWELLPWHANGTLDPDEAARVDEHLAACAICREEVRACRELAVGLAGAPEPMPEDGAELGGAEAGLARLMARIDDDEDVSDDDDDGGRARRADRWRALIATTPRPVRRLIAAQAAALILLAAGIAVLAGPGTGSGAPDRSPATFRTLADPAPAATAAAGARVRVVFAEGASTAAVRDLLLAAGARMVDGPTPFGVYAVVPLAAGEGESSRLLARLRADPAVVFAEPALPSRPEARPASSPAEEPRAETAP